MDNLNRFSVKFHPGGSLAYGILRESNFRQWKIPWKIPYERGFNMFWWENRQVIFPMVDYQRAQRGEIGSVDVLIFHLSQLVGRLQCHWTSNGLNEVDGIPNRSILFLKKSLVVSPLSFWGWKAELACFTWRKTSLESFCRFPIWWVASRSPRWFHPKNLGLVTKIGYPNPNLWLIVIFRIVSHFNKSYWC